MEEQSDTPRTDATQYRWTRTLDLARDLERELATATRQLDEALALNAKWADKIERDAVAVATHKGGRDD